jgi:o-succinylbenzoate synthase
MRIETIVLRELAMKLKAPFETSSEITWDRRVLLVEVGSDGFSGWAEITAAEDPFYNAETTETAWHIFKDFMVPVVLGRSVQNASEIQGLLAAIRGHQMAKAGLENALWDIEAQQRGMPLAKLLGGTQAEIPCGVSVGIQESVATLLAKIDVELRAGYQRVKMKIKPGKDLDVVAAVRDRYPEIKLMVDANSAYQLKDVDRLRAFDQYDLTMIEQPLAWDDIYQHASLQAQLKTPICLDECVQTPSHAEAAIKLGACRIINIKLGRVGGHSLAKQVHDVCLGNSIPVWCGGMLESGIGRAHNIAMSTLPGFVLPGDVSASQRYWNEDIIEPEVEVSGQGTIRVPTSPGLGYGVRLDRIESFTVRREHWRAEAMSAPVASPAKSVEQAVGTKANDVAHRGNVDEGEIPIRDVESFDELEQVEALEQEVWGVTAREIVPRSLLIPARAVGSILLGAFDGKHLVGFVFGFVGLENGQATIHSHALAVKRGYRDHNLGYRLKLAQREKALAAGIRQITWTYDPLQGRNAYLNFAKLGVVCDSYKVNFYGEQSSSFLHQNGTDRFWVRWLLDSRRVRERIESGHGRNQAGASSAAASLVQVAEDGRPYFCLDARALHNGPQVSIEIPIYGEHQPDGKHMLEWRTATRRAFTEALRAGFVVSDFSRSHRGTREIGTYVLFSKS